MMCGDDIGMSAKPQTTSPNEPWVGEMALQVSNGEAMNVGESGHPDAFVPLQDWITALDYLNAPGDPQWLAQELLHGIRNLESQGSPGV